MKKRKLMTAAVSLVITAGVAGVIRADEAIWCDEEENCRSVEDLMQEELMQGAGDGVNVVWVGSNDKTPNVFQFGTFIGRRGYLGTVLVDLTPELRAHFGAPEDSGVLVGRVQPDSPAAAAGLQVGDIITYVDDQEATSPTSVARIVRAKQDGDSIDLEVWRDGSPMNVTAIAAEHDKEQLDLARWMSAHQAEGEESANRFVLRFDEDTAAGLDHLLEEESFLNNMHSFNALEDELQQRIEDLESKLRALEAELEALGRD